MNTTLRGFVDNVARKDDGEKARFDLIPAEPLMRLADTYTMGAKKYADRNWEKGLKWGRVYAAICRHLWQFWMGEDNDKESGLPHLAHAAWGCMTLLEYRKTHAELDDRAGKTHSFKQEANQTDMVFQNEPSEADKKYWEDHMSKVFVDVVSKHKSEKSGQSWAPAGIIPGKVYLGHDSDLRLRSRPVDQHFAARSGIDPM